MISHNKREGSGGVIVVDCSWLLFYVAITVFGFANHPAATPAAEVARAAAGAN